MTTARKTSATALGYMAAAAVLFASMNFFARIASTSTSWATVGAVRALVGALVAFAVAKMRGASLAVTNHRAMMWRSLLGTTAMLLTFYSLSSRTLSLGDTVTLLNLTPVFLAVLAPVVLAERTSGRVGLAILVALGGVVLVLHPSFSFGDGANVPGPSARGTAVAAVAAAFSSSLAMMMLRRLGRSETPESIAVHFSLFAALTLGLLSLFDLRMPSARDAACMVAAGVCAGFGQLAMTRAYALERAARVSAMGYLAVVASALLGAAVLQERPTFGAAIGMGLVVAGGVLVTFAREEEPEDAKRDKLGA
ncbi:MAG: DMT family transporter [Deltaproteobacteria bacterium]|nr:DMT family transporter [Deltaproteobacteria bacterium]